MCTVVLPPGAKQIANYAAVTIHITRSHVSYICFYNELLYKIILKLSEGL